MEVRSGYKQTEVGVIPEDWDVKSLNEVSWFQEGPGVRNTQFTTFGIKLLNGTNIFRGELNLDTTDRFISVREAYGPYAHFLADEGDIVIASSGITVERLHEKVAYVRAKDLPFCMNTSTIRFKPRSGVLERLFLFHLLGSDNFKKQIGGQATGSAQLNFGPSHVAKVSLPLPPLLEQRSIAAALSDFDALLGGLDRLIAKKSDLKQAAMQQLLTGQTRLASFSGDWEVKRLGDVISHCFSGATPRRNRPEFYKGNIRWITSGELNYNVIFDTAEKISAEAVAETNLAVVPAGTFLMAVTGLEAEGTRGACAIVGAPSTTNQSCMAVFPTAALVSKYLFHYYVFRGKPLALQYCQGTKQQSYTASLVKQLPVALPPSVEEQNAIADVLSSMDVELAALEARRDKTRDLKQAMLQELLTGKTRLVRVGAPLA